MRKPQFFLVLWEKGLTASLDFGEWHIIHEYIPYQSFGNFHRVYSGGEFLGLKTTVFDRIWAVVGAYKRHTPQHIGLLSPQISTDLRGVKNPWKIGGNPPIGGKEYTLFHHIVLNQLKTHEELKEIATRWQYLRLLSNLVITHV